MIHEQIVQVCQYDFFYPGIHLCILQEYLDYGVKAFHFLSVVQVLANRNSGLREDGKVGNRDTAAGDPPGLRDQVNIPTINHP